MIGAGTDEAGTRVLWPTTGAVARLDDSPGAGRVPRPAVGRRRATAAVTLLLVVVAAVAVAAPAPAFGQPTDVMASLPTAAQPPGGGDGFGEGEVVDRYGIPVFEYEIAGRQGGGVDGTFQRLGIWLADVLFSISRLIVVGLIWLLDFALDFGVADLMLTPIQQLIGVYETNFVGNVSGGGWGLVPLALMICVFWFGLAALRGRVGKGVGEITVSFVLSVVLGAILANPGGFLLGDEGLMGRARDIGVDVATTAVQPPTSDPPPCVQRPPVGGEELVDGCFIDDFGDGAPPTRSDPQYLRWVMQMWLVDMYVRRPHQQMTYGQRLDCPLVLTVRGEDEANRCDASYEDGGDHTCVDRYNQILQANSANAPEAAGANQGSYMYDMMHPDEPVEGCPEGEELAAYLDSGGGDRIAVGALLLLALLVLAAFLVVGVLIPIIVGQLMVAILAVALIFVLPIALVGGGGRRILWKWFGLLLAAAFMIIVSLVGLALMLITTELLLQSQQRYFFINLLMVGISSVLFIWLQRKVLAGSLLAGRRAGQAIADVPIGVTSGMQVTVTALAGRARPDPAARAATAGYRPLDVRQHNRKGRKDLERERRYGLQWERKQERRVGSWWRLRSRR
jgi:hypothetical protein